MFQRLRQRLRGTPAQPLWEYKVVQLVAQPPASPEDASRKLGGSLSAEALRSQFPEYYANQNGRRQINDFLNRLGDDGWELVQVQQIADLPLMVFKRPKRLAAAGNLAKQEPEAEEHHAQQPC